MSYPTSIDDGSTLPNPTGTSTQASPDHAALHTSENTSIIAVETKLGTGASTPSGSNLLVSTGTGTSAWSKTAPTGTIVGTSDSQTLTNKTLTSPTVNTPTITNATISADAVSGYTTSNTGTVYGMSVTGGVLASAAILNSVNTAAIQTNAVDYTKVAAGFPVQMVSTNFSAVATGTTTIPADDTIPQITEGTEFMTQTITPKSATNVLVIEFIAMVSYSVGAAVIGATFQDTTANALAVGDVRNTAAGEFNMLVVRHTMTAGTTSATTFRLRIGGDGAGTVTFNGNSGNRFFGTAPKSSVVIMEYKA
jgi:hypothetical protein